MSDAAAAEVVVRPAWLADHRETVRIVDVRDAWEYDGIGHIPGAVNVPFETFRGGDADVGMLPGVDRFAELMRQAGIATDDTVVAYDDEHGVFAARFVVTAWLYGHADCRLLNGDYSAWNRQYETSTEPSTLPASDYQATIPSTRPLIDADGVLAAIDDPDAVLVDTRSTEEFAEGHIAGAVHLDWRDLVDPDTRGFKDQATLREQLAADGITPDRRIVLYCNTARRISHTYVGLRWLGFENIAFYEGSLTDWRERDLSLETGTERG
ncbi:MAG: sulfurtransferase [Halobacteriales archaeon]|nr:sulfurtransferase [Halobacteriales archaeon]